MENNYWEWRGAEARENVMEEGEVNCILNSRKHWREGRKKGDG